MDREWFVCEGILVDTIEFVEWDKLEAHEGEEGVELGQEVFAGFSGTKMIFVRRREVVLGENVLFHLFRPEGEHAPTGMNVVFKVPAEKVL